MMATKFLGSLTNRIFLASAALAVVSIGAAVYFVSRATTREAEAALQRGLIEAGTLVDQQRAQLVQTFTVMAGLVADLPKLKAAVAENHPPTVQPIAADYQQQIGSSLLVVTNPEGRVLASAGSVQLSPEEIRDRAEIRAAVAGRRSSGFWPHGDGVLQVVAVPIAIDLDRPELLGTLAVGFRFDNLLAERFKRVTESDIAFAVDGQIRASTLPSTDQPQLRSLLHARDVQRVSLSAGEYVALRRPLSDAVSADTNAPMVLLLRSRTEQLRFLNAIHTGLGAMAIVAVLTATILSYAVARTITRPIAAITDAMREISATGDLARKIQLRRAGSWEDEDAKLLASTFNSLIDSLARFQREAAQRERLSALGRLSTVIAHEIRNPLMIIKASLRTLEDEHASREAVRQTLTDVNEEVARLNRIVHDVLDFARPIRFDYAHADLNALCADAEQATRAEAPHVTVALHRDASLAPIVVDAERLRTALVNILANARHAVAARDTTVAAGSKGPAGADIEMRTMRMPDGRVSIEVRDQGAGIAPADMPRVFDPYFTTKRTGSGLGLAIAKNIIEGMGGVIALDSLAGQGTHIRIDLPADHITKSPDREIAT
jgi:signal transduction histidine kinase